MGVSELWDIFLCLGAMSTKSKNLVRIQYFQALGILMRGCSQPAGDLKVKSKKPHFNDISIGKKSLSKKNAGNVVKAIRAPIRDNFSTNPKV